MKKVSILFMLILTSVFCHVPSLTVEASARPIFTDFTVSINGEAQKLQKPILNINDRSYIPLRELSNLFHAEVIWDEATQQITIETLPKIYGEIEIESISAENIFESVPVNYGIFIDGKQMHFEDAVYSINWRTYVPLRAFAEHMDKNVTWIEEEKHIAITDRQDEVLYPFYQNGLCGYMDENGVVKCPAEYVFATDFSDGAGIVTDRDGKKGFVNADGELFIACRYADATWFENGIAAVQSIQTEENAETAKWFVIDKEGKVLYEAETRWIHTFSGGIAQICTDDGTQVFVDKTGKRYTVSEGEVMEVFEEGYVSVEMPDGGEKLFNNRMEPVMEGYDEFYEVHDGFLTVRKGKKYGVVDFQNRVVLDFQYISLGRFSEGLIPYSTYTDENGNPVFGYLDKTGKIVIPPGFRYAGAFQSGEAIVRDLNGNMCKMDKNGTVLSVLPTDGEMVGNLIRVIPENDLTRLYYMNKKGEVVMPQNSVRTNAETMRLVGEKIKELDDFPEMNQAAVLVNGQTITRKEVEAMKIWCQYTGGDSLEDRIRGAIQKIVINTEADRLGIEPSQDKIDAYMKEEKTVFETNAVGTEYIISYMEGMGMKKEEYFKELEKSAYNMFQRDALRVHVLETGISTDFDAYVENLIENAEVIYFE